MGLSKGNTIYCVLLHMFLRVEEVFGLRMDSQGVEMVVKDVESVAHQLARVYICSWESEESIVRNVQEIVDSSTEEELHGKNANGHSALMNVLLCPGLSDEVRERIVMIILEKTNPQSLAPQANNGAISLMYALQSGDIGSDPIRERIVMAILAKSHADSLRIQNNRGNTSLMIALTTTKIESEPIRENIVAAILAKSDADSLSLQDRNGEVSLTKALETRSIKCELTRERIVFAILNHCTADALARQDSDGFTPLMTALSTRAIKSEAMRERIIAAILEKMQPDDMGLPSNCGLTVLGNAIHSNAIMSEGCRERIVQLLLEKSSPDIINLEKQSGFKHLKDGHWRLQWSKFMKDAKGKISDEYEQSEKDGKPLCMQGQNSLPSLFKQVLPSVINEEGWRALMLQGTEKLRIGFAKLNILSVDGCNLRLHIFDPEFLQKDVEGIHSHKWVFQSHILYGDLKAEIWKLRKNCTDEELSNARAAGSKFEFTKEINDQGFRCAVLESKNPVDLCMVDLHEYVQGDSYLFPLDAIHKVVDAARRSATLMLSGPTTATAKEYKDSLNETGQTANVGQSLFAENESLEKDQFGKLLDNAYSQMYNKSSE